LTAGMEGFTRDPGHWLRRLSPDEWIHAALGEISRSTKAFEQGNARAGAAGVKRAAGMALNAALIVEPRPTWGRTYVEHLEALAVDPEAPVAVRSASRRVLDAKPPSGDVVNLRTPRAHLELVEAARDVIAHAWTVVKRHETASK
jgi:HEPN domain-containing protein